MTFWPELSGQAIRTPTFRRFARIHSQKHTYFWSKVCKPERLGEGSKIGKSPKVVPFGPTAPMSPKSSLHHVQACFALRLRRWKRLVAPSVQKTLCTLSWPLSAILLFSTPLPGALVCNRKWLKSDFRGLPQSDLKATLQSTVCRLRAL